MSAFVNAVAARQPAASRSASDGSPVIADSAEGERAVLRLLNGG